MNKMDMLKVSNVSKSFSSNKIIDNLNFSVPENTIFGFIGENGAGKTTTMKMILGLLKMDSGEIFVNNEKVEFGQNKTNKFIGYLPDVPEFYNYMTPFEYLNLCGKITGMSSNEIKDRSNMLLNLVGLDKATKRINGFSRGMKQRLGIAQALLNNPKLLICDEPTSALDPLGRKEILDILYSVKKHTTIIFSTHILSDVERICDEIAFLHNGSIALQGSLEEVKHIHKNTGFNIEFHNQKDLNIFISKFPEGKPINMRKLHYKNKDEKDILEVMHFLVENQIPILQIETLEPTLESLFMEVIGK